MNTSKALNQEDPAVTVSVQSLLDERHTRHERTLHPPAGSGLWTGNFRGARRGHGTDFDDLRHYSPGDEIRHIDWNASARTNTLHTRLYREEREHRVTLITDLRTSMFTGTRVLRSVKACRLSARLLWQAVAGGSRASVIVICDAGISASEYGNGHRAAIDACGLLARRFLAIQQQIKPIGQHTEAAQETMADDVLITLPAPLSEPDTTSTTCEQLAHWLSAQRQLHGTLIWVSAFDQPGERFNEAMETLSQATRQVAVHVDDEMLENGLPAGSYGYRSGQPSDRVSHSVTLSRKQSRHLQQKLLQQKQDRMTLFSNLLIPLLTTDSGNAEIVATLRQGGYLP